VELMQEPRTGGAADAYLIAHLHDALLADDRLHEQAVEIVVVSSGRIALRGEVATPERREAALTLVRDLVPDMDVIDDLCVTSVTADQQAEPL
jgi:hypothetical protein